MEKSDTSLFWGFWSLNVLAQSFLSKEPWNSTFLLVFVIDVGGTGLEWDNCPDPMIFWIHWILGSIPPTVLGTARHRQSEWRTHFPRRSLKHDKYRGDELDSPGASRCLFRSRAAAWDGSHGCVMQCVPVQVIGHWVEPMIQLTGEERIACCIQREIGLSTRQQWIRRN